MWNGPRVSRSLLHDDEVRRASRSAIQRKTANAAVPIGLSSETGIDTASRRGNKTKENYFLDATTQKHADKKQ